MRISTSSMPDTKEYVRSLMAKPLYMYVNRGRNRIDKYDGEITDVYPQVFVVKIDGEDNITQLSFSYSDVLCGDIKFLVK